MYRAGGPTTIFGGSGWGPYSDGPLNAVRKSMLNRDGLNEENWMAVAAERTMEASAEWAKLRMEGLKVCGGILGDVGRDRGKKRAAVEDGEAEGGTSKKRRGWIDDSELPLGVYEPQTGIILCGYSFIVVYAFTFAHKRIQTGLIPSPRVVGGSLFQTVNAGGFWAVLRRDMARGLWRGSTQSWSCPEKTRLI